MLKWYQRLIAITYAYGGTVHVANLLGLGPEVPADRAGLFRAFDIYFLILDAVAAVGLWRGTRIGLAAFVVAAASQLVMYTGFGDFFATNEMMRSQLNGLLAYHVVTVTAMGAVYLFTDKSGAKAAISRRPLLTFVVVAFAFTAMAWIPAIVAGGVGGLPTGWQVPQQVIPVFGPWLGALVVSYAAGGTSAARSNLRNAVRLGGAWRSVLVAVAVAAVVAIGALGFNQMVATEPIDIALPTLATAALTVLAMTLVGGGQEEPGWRGFALPRLEARFGRVTGTVALAVMWAAWHSPLWLIHDSPQASLHPVIYLLHLVPFSMIFTWLWHQSNGSVPVAMLFHGLNNAVALLLVIEPAGNDRFGDFLPSLIVVEWIVALALALARTDPVEEQVRRDTPTDSKALAY